MEHKKESPLIVLFTSHNCGHCTKYRNGDGIPRDNTEFSDDKIKSLLRGSNQKVKMPCSKLIEVHVEYMSASSPILELNIYSFGNSFKQSGSEIKSGGFGKYLSERDDSLDTDILERISIRRNKSLEISVSIDGLYSKFFTEEYFDHFTWNKMPHTIKHLRKAIHNGEDISEVELNKLNDNSDKTSVGNFSKILYKKLTNKKQLDKFTQNPSLLDSFLLTYFGFDNIISHLVPTSCRIYPSSYPTWMLVSQKEWYNSINSDNCMFARITNYHTKIDKHGKYYTKLFSSDQSITNLINSYYTSSSNILEYDNHETSKYTWQDDDNEN